MNSKIKKDLVLVGLVIVTILAIAGSLYLGSIMSPILILIGYVISFNFILLPIFTNTYYDLYEMENPGWKSFIPLYNATLTAKPIWAILSYILVLINVIVLILIGNTWIFAPLGDKMVFTIIDVLPLVLMITFSAYYIVSGIALATPLLQCKEVYIEFFRDSDEIRSGFARFLMNTGTLTKYLELIILMLPIFRIIPMFVGFNRIMELKRFRVSFLDFE